MTLAALFCAVVMAALIVRHWYRSALAKQAADDVKALDGPHPAMPYAKIGRKFSSPEMGRQHDEAKAVAARKKADIAERRRARAAVSRTPRLKIVAPTTVTPMRKVAR